MHSIALWMAATALWRASSATGQRLRNQYFACSIVEILTVSPSVVTMVRGWPQFISIITPIWARTAQNARAATRAASGGAVHSTVTDFARFRG